MSVYPDRARISGRSRTAPAARSIVLASVFPLGGKTVPAILKEVRAGGALEKLKNGVTECSFAGPLMARPSLLLRMTFRIAPDNPVVRFRYSLDNQGAEAAAFEQADGPLTYLSTSLANMSRVKEVRLSDFNSMLHSDTVSEFNVPQRWFTGRLNVAGPILIGEGEDHEALLLAYEHGSQMPDTFLRFDLQPDRVVKLVAVKGNYLSGQALKVFDTVWMEAAVSPAGRVAGHFRTFVLSIWRSKERADVRICFTTPGTFKSAISGGMGRVTSPRITRKECCRRSISRIGWGLRSSSWLPGGTERRVTGR